MKSLFKRIARRFSITRAKPGGRPAAPTDPDFLDRKRAKLERIGPLLDDALPHERELLFYDFLTEELRREFNIAATENISAHGYDNEAEAIIGRFSDGFILDCGAGYRADYLDNVVNFEICDYPSTDVRGVGERLPFHTGAFDAVFSFSVLEHVRDPFACAKELVRVLKPGGQLYCVVPFLQPFHAYPHHYYNMTAQGLANLFGDAVEVERQEVNTGGMPIFMLTWVLRRWADGLSGAARREFLELKVADLLAAPASFLERGFVTELERNCRFELAATTSLFARKV
ncbi:MAG TPA: class I SAM-dependent methyltransferase [Urbifossiella sp.]|nr:class I SAM-dependent methyltransferase [Urbifossiella sp.]